MLQYILPLLREHSARFIMKQSCFPFSRQKTGYYNVEKRRCYHFLLSRYLPQLPLLAFNTPVSLLDRRINSFFFLVNVSSCMWGFSRVRLFVMDNFLIHSSSLVEQKLSDISQKLWTGYFKSICTLNIFYTDV